MMSSVAPPAFPQPQFPQTERMRVVSLVLRIVWLLGLAFLAFLELQSALSLRSPHRMDTDHEAPTLIQQETPHRHSAPVPNKSENTSHNSTSVQQHDKTSRFTATKNSSSLHQHADIPHTLRPHPHAGAIDQHGNPGYVHDPKFLIRRRPIPFDGRITGFDVCDIPARQGEEGRYGYAALQKIRVTTPPPNHKTVLCIILANSISHDVVRIVAETWGQYCDGFMAASNWTDPSIGAVNILHMGPEHYDNMWQKTRSIWAYVHDHYLEQFDFFHMGPDDSFVIPENLQSMLSTFHNEEEEPLFLGIPMMKWPQIRVRYCSGGGGYTMNRIALSRLVKEVFPVCRPNDLVGEEDTNISECFRKLGKRKFQFQCMNTADEKGEARYHFLDANFIAGWTRDQPAPWWTDEMEKYHNVTYKEGLEGVSETSVSFHLKKDDMFTVARDRGVRRYHAVVRGLCGDLSQPVKTSTTLDADLPHPHGGARNAAGNLRYIYDVTSVRKNPPNFTFQSLSDGSSICNLPGGQGVEGTEGYKALQKIRISETVSDTKVLCIVMTHSERHDALQAIAETYGQRCDGFLAASNQTDPAIGAVNIVHAGGGDDSSSRWQKVRSIWAYVYSHYLDEYDFFHLAPDNSYVIVENLRHLVSQAQSNDTEKLYMGGSVVARSKIKRHCGEAPGYTISRALLERFAFKRLPNCEPDGVSLRADAQFGLCLRSFKARCMNTNDEHNATRYHFRDADWRAKWTTDMDSPWKHEHLLKYHNIASEEKLAGISETSVSFNLGDLENGIRRYHAILYGLCNGTV